jgi:hypothetical protein
MNSPPTRGQVTEVPGVSHPVALAFQANRVTTLDSQQSSRSSNLLSSATVEAYVRTLGPEHPDTQIAKNRKSRTLIALDAVPV